MALPWKTERIAANGLEFETAVMGEGESLVLCLHGFPETSYSWRHQMPLLAEAGYTVWAPNMRGYGQTTRPTKLRDYALPKLVEDVAGLHDAARARGHVPRILMAHDWGGIVAWQAILRNVRPFEKFIAINIPHPTCVMDGFWREGQFRKSWYIFFFQLPWLPERGLTRANGAAIDRIFKDTVARPENFPEEVIQVFRENALIPGCATAMLNYYRALLRHPDSRRMMRERLSTDVPTLLIWGEEDVSLGVHLTDDTERYVSDLTLVRLPGVSHWAQQDAPDLVNRHIADWLGLPQH